MSEATTTTGPSAAELLELFGGVENGMIYSWTLQEHRHRVVELTGIDLPYSQSSIRRFLDAGGEERVLEALAEAAEEDR